MPSRKQATPNLNRYLVECGLLYHGFRCYLPTARESQDEILASQGAERPLLIKICQKTKYTERLLLFFQGDNQPSWWQDWVLELRLYHDVYSAEVTAYQVEQSEGRFALKALSFDDKIRFHHLLLEWLVLRMNPTPIN
ncbi:MAG: DUF1249 domain-containing protein [Gammaproteobacteria bacterium]